MATQVQSPLELTQAPSTPAAPDAGTVGFYAKSDGALHTQTPAGVEAVLAVNIVVGPAQPSFASPGLWIQTDSSGSNILEFWVGQS